MTYNQSPHLFRDAAQDAIEEDVLVKKGWNPRIAKAAIFAKRMQHHEELIKQARESSGSNDSNN